MKNFFEKINKIPLAKLLAMFLVSTMLDGQKLKQESQPPINKITEAKPEQDRLSTTGQERTSNNQSSTYKNIVDQEVNSTSSRASSNPIKPKGTIQPSFLDENLSDEFYFNVDRYINIESELQSFLGFISIYRPTLLFSNIDTLLASEDLPFTAYNDGKPEKIGVILSKNDTVTEGLVFYFDLDGKFNVIKLSQNSTSQENLEEEILPIVDTADRSSVYDLGGGNSLELKREKSKFGTTWAVYLKNKKIMVLFQP